MLSACGRISSKRIGPIPTPEIAAKAQELAAGAPDLYTKLSRITAYIQKNIRYFIIVKGIGGWQAHYAADIYRNRYGDCKDKTTLLISMLQAIGIRAYYLHVNSERGVINPDAPSLIGNHMITRNRVAGWGKRSPTDGARKGSERQNSPHLRPHR